MLPLAPLQPRSSSKTGRFRPRRRFSLVVGLALAVCVMGAVGIYLLVHKIGGSGPVTLHKDETGEWNLKRLSKRSQEEQEYLAKLIDTRDSLLFMRLVWTDFERINTFPYGDYWKGMPATSGQAALRRMQMTVGNGAKFMQELVNNYNALQRASEPFLAIRPELQEAHESIRLDTDMKFEVTNPLVGFAFESMETKIGDMLSALGVTLPEPKAPRK